MAREIPDPVDLSKLVIGLHRGGDARVIESAPGPPVRIDGYTVGAPVLTRPPPHNGEMHPDGDELLFLVSGHLTVLVEEQGSESAIELQAGQALVVPRGVWHRVVPNETSQLVHITPGPGGEHRPLPEKDPE